jgi:hypothetical protein
VAKLYTKVTSDTGPTVTTRSGRKILTHVITADTEGGRSEVIITLEVVRWGDVVCKVRVSSKRGFRYVGP